MPEPTRPAVRCDTAAVPNGVSSPLFVSGYTGRVHLGRRREHRHVGRVLLIMLILVVIAAAIAAAWFFTARRYRVNTATGQATVGKGNTATLVAGARTYTLDGGVSWINSSGTTVAGSWPQCLPHSTTSTVTFGWLWVQKLHARVVVWVKC